MDKRKTTIAAVLAVLLLLILWGFIGKGPFFRAIRAVENKLFAHGEPNGLEKNIPEHLKKSDIRELISIKSPQDVFSLRDKLIDFLWEKDSLPPFLPSHVSPETKDQRYEDIPSLLGVDRIVMKMDFGIESIAYHFLPKTPNGKAVLFHQGHSGDFFQSKDLIKAFLDQGFSVAGLCMPLKGLNNQPLADIPGIGKMKLAFHYHMKFLKPADGHPVKYFIEPVIMVLNYLEKEHGINRASMMGVSGGGWTTTLAAAVDERIEQSFSVAGSLPLYLRENREWGDWEQSAPELYTRVNYLELYVLASHGPGRSFTQIHNLYDPCCFSGTKAELYTETVQNLVGKIGEGEYRLFLDDTHKDHAVSPAALERIIHQISQNTLD